MENAWINSLAAPLDSKMQHISRRTRRTPRVKTCCATTAPGHVTQLSGLPSTERCASLKQLISINYAVFHA